MTYPEPIIKRLADLTHCRDLQTANAEGIGVNLACGSTVRFILEINQDGRVLNAAFRSNGCGYSRTAADFLAEWIANKQLVDLHGLDDAELNAIVRSELGEIPADNLACTNAAISAMKDAFANFRMRLIDEFRGPDALVCTCFGVTEERIEDLIAKSHLTSVEQVTALCSAGSGCGSCRMLIQEMLDSVL